MSTRFFYRRGKKVHVEQLDDVVAMPATGEQADELAVPPALPKSVVENAQGAPLVTHDAKAFRHAGWMIVEAAQADEVAGAGAAAGPEGAPVFRDPEQGRLLIGTTRITVKFKPDVSNEAAAKRLEDAGLRVLRKLGFSKNLFQVEVAAGKDPLAIAVSLQESADVEYAEPEMIEHVPGRVRPTDPQYPRQWQWNNDGSLSGTVNADVRAELAWDSGKGKDIRVAVIDNGFDVTHPDLSPGLDPGTAFFERSVSADPVLRRTLIGYPDADHGTFCAGMVGARVNNGKGGCGAAPEASLMLIACLGDQVGTQLTLARAVAYAADPALEPEGAGMAGADIIACSLGPNNAPWQITSVLDDALTFAATNGRGGKGITIFWAVDNAPNPVANDEVCSHSATIAVGRSTRGDRENGSAFGPELDFLAPGVDVFSTESGGGFGSSTGTSFAAPCAAGVAALALAAKSAATSDETRKALVASCEKVGGVTYDSQGRHVKYGSGRINAARAIDAILGVLDDSQDAVPEAAAAPVPVAALGPQLPQELGRGEYRWTAPSTLNVKLLDGSVRTLEVSIIENRGIFEGDIVLTRGLESLGIGVVDIGKRWRNRTVIYDILPTLPDQDRVTEAIAHWTTHTVIKWKRRQTEQSYVLFRPGSVCSSAVGMIGGVQFITLAKECKVGNVIHEMGHAVGLWHEQSRHDRDQHVSIRWENIQPSAHHNFRQQLQDGEDINEYDHGSIMHYSAMAFSINEEPTIVPVDPAKTIGQREKLSAGDIAAVAKMYASV